MGSVSSNPTQDEAQNNNNTYTNNVKSLELDEMSFSFPVYPPLKQMLNWSLKEIRVVYEKFQRRSNSNTPFIDKIFFCKLVPFTRSNAAYIFDSFSRKKEFISIYEFLCILTICSYTHFINKIHFFYVLFDLDCGGDISLNELLIVFKSTITGYCKLTDTTLPNNQKLEKFAKLMFLKSDIQADNALELKEIIQWCEGNARAMELFARFEPKYKIKEKFEVFKNFQPYPSEIALDMLKQINKANHDETYLDQLSEITKKDKANSYMKSTSSFNNYQKHLQFEQRMERSVTIDQIKKSVDNQIMRSEQQNFFNLNKKYTSYKDGPKFFDKIQHTQDNDNEINDETDLALLMHQTICQGNTQIQETISRFPKLGKTTAYSMHQSQTTLKKTRIQTHEGQISRQEILKLIDYFQSMKFQQKILLSRQENQIKREEQNQKLESEVKIRIQKEIEDEEYFSKINTNTKKSRSITQDTKNLYIQKQEFQKKENQKNDKIRAEKEYLEDQKLQIDSDYKLHDFLQVCLYKKDIKEVEKIKTYLLQINIEKLQENYYEEIILNIYSFLNQMDKQQRQDVLKTILEWFVPYQQKKPNNIIITKGTAITKQEIWKLKEYFDFLSDKEKTIKINKFSKAMQDKRHMKRVSKSLFQYLDSNQTTEITFDQLLLGIYPSLQSKDIQTINSWVKIYSKTFDMQSKDQKIVQNEEETKPIIKKKKILPASTLIRIKEIYSNLDEERKGYVTIDNIRQKFTYGFTHKDIEKLFDQYDANKDGVLEVPDFARMILPPDYTIEGIE